MGMRVIAVLAITALVLAGCASTPEAEPSTSDEPLPAMELPLQINDDVEALRDTVAAAVAAGAPVALATTRVNVDAVTIPTTSESVTYDVVLERDTRFLTNETWLEMPANLTVGLDAIELYEGHVEGAEDEIVRVAIGPNWARGYVRVGDVQYILRMGLENNIPLDAPIVQTGIERATQFPETFDGKNYRDHDCLSLAPTDLTPMVEVGHSAKGRLTADIILDADALMMEQLGEHTVPFLVAMFWENDAIYQYETGIDFHLVGVHVHEEFVFDVDAGDVFAPVRDYWNERSDDRDIVHIVTGSESSYAMANCIGGAGIPSEAYTFTPLNWEYEYEIFHLTALAHELGHIFNAHHHYGNHAEANGELATLMIQGYTPGVNPVFSTMSKTTIRGWADAYVA